MTTKYAPIFEGIHPSDVIDYSTLASYLTCPRKYLFRHILNFEKAGYSIDLMFGKCWHDALEAGYLHMQTAQQEGHPYLSLKEIVELSRSAFRKSWDAQNIEAQFDEAQTYPKNPTHAFDMLSHYWQNFYEEDKRYQILAVEAPFHIGLGQGLPSWIGRRDLVTLRDNNFLRIVEHKTAKYISEWWLSSYENSYQIEGYLMSGQVYYEKLPEIILNGALCQKSKIDFIRHTITRQEQAINRFLTEITGYLTGIVTEYEHIKSLIENAHPCVKDRNWALPHFPRNNEVGCTTYMRLCPYFHLCLGRNNPLTYRLEMDRAPSGFNIHHWDPRAHVEEKKEKENN